MRLAFSVIFASIVIVTSTVLVSADDDQIARDIQTALKAQQNVGNLKNFRLDVSVNDGVVRMNGYVTEERQRDLALGIASRIPGVEMVVKDVSVVSPSETESGPDGMDRAVASGSSFNLPKILRGKALQTGHHQSPFSDEQHSILANSTDFGGGVTNLAYPNPTQNGSVGEAAIIANQAMELDLGPPIEQPGRMNPARMSPALASPEMKSMPSSRSGQTSQTPLAFARAKTLLAKNSTHGIGHPGSPLPANIPGVDAAAVPTRYDHASMPGYAWPSYASYPNYGALAYPQQYSASAWPYIGPFYPYPQVPLGWRKVTLEWDDGWWWLDFQSH